MRKVALALLASGMLLSGSLSPLTAQERRPGEVMIVDAGTFDEPNDLPELLSGDEIALIETLQAQSTTTGLLSPISPDGQVAWGFQGNAVGLIDLQTGTFEAVDIESLGFLIPAAFGGSFPLSWLDNDTIGGIAIDFGANSESELLVHLLYRRSSRSFSAQRFDANAVSSVVQDNVFPFSFAPNGTRAIFAVVPEEEEEPASGSAGYPLSELRIAPERPAGGSPALLRPDRLAVPARSAAAVSGSDLFARLESRRFFQESFETLQVSEVQIPLVYVDLVTGEQRELAVYDEATVFFAEAWSADSARYALTTTGFPDDAPRGRYDGALVSEQVYKDVTGQFPPSENPYLQNNVIRIFDMGTGLDRSVNNLPGDGTFKAAIGWSPDNQSLLMLALHPARVAGRRYPIYTFQFIERYDYRFYNTNLVETQRLSLPNVMAGGLASPTNAFFLSPDELLFTVMSGVDLLPYYYNRVSGEVRRIGPRAGSYLIQGASSATRQIAFAHSSFTEPFELYRVNWDGSAFAQLSFANIEQRAAAEYSQHSVSFRLRNGQIRTGVLLLPPGVSYPPRNIPLVVWQEGGPGGAINNYWSNFVERPYGLLPSFGFGLLITPLAGREGYDGPTLNLLAANANYGSIDVDEQAEIVRQAISRGWTSQGRIGISGCSYGGYFVWQSVIRHPTLYAAGNPQCALVDMVTEWARGYDRLAPYLEGPRTPYNAGAEFRADSPIYNSDRVQAAMLSFHGTFDFLPFVQNENLHQAIVDRGGVSRHLRFVGAGHGLLGVCCDVPEDAGDRYERYAAQEQILWFRDYLK